MRTTSGSRPIDAGAVAKSRPRSEVLMWLIQPLATAGVHVLARFGVDPQALVWTHAMVGTAAAVAIAAGGTAAWWTAAGLLLVKTLLDNMDGGLARATGRVTEMGRYLDTVLDTLVNAALFVALALHGPRPWAWPLAAGAYLVLVAILSLDYNLERRYRALRGRDDRDWAVSAGAPEAWVATFRNFYERFLRPQDRLVERLDESTFARLRGRSYDSAALVDRLAWNDLWSTATLVNLGLSTQLLLLAVCLLLERPFAYVLLVYLMGAYVIAVQAWRMTRFRRHLRGAR